MSLEWAGDYWLLVMVLEVVLLLAASSAIGFGLRWWESQTEREREERKRVA